MTDVPAPQWFRAALAQPPEELTLTHDGLRLHYRAWGGRGQRVVVLVHGGSAHSGWWDHIAPLLAAGHRVVAPDLSGHGRSDRRASYGLDSWAGEVLALADAESADAEEPPLVVGHSMGGWVTLMAATLAGDRLAGIVVLDSPLRERSPEERAAAARRRRTTLPLYPDRATATTHFHLTPGQDTALPYVVDHIAATSVHEVEGGWTWLFDPMIWQRITEQRPALAAVRCPTTLLASEKGLLTAEMLGRARSMLGGPVIAATLPNAGHHAMVDEPLALVTALRLELARLEQDTP